MNNKTISICVIGSTIITSTTYYAYKVMKTKINNEDQLLKCDTAKKSIGYGLTVGGLTLASIITRNYYINKK